MGIFDGVKVLEKRKSKFNGEIEVVKSLAWGIYIQVEGLTQSGGVVEGIWNKTLKKVKKEKPEIESCLILGLGGGSVAKIVSKIWPGVSIVGVDIDPVVVELGKKYLGLDKIEAQIQIVDAVKFIASSKKHFDLIIVDMYRGHNIPEEFDTEEFVKDIKKLLTKNGIAIFNRLYTQGTSGDATRFGLKLQKIFSQVQYFYPEANLMLICS